MVSKFVKEGVLKCLYGSDPAMWGVAHDLVEQVVELLPIGLLLEDLHNERLTFSHGRAAILGNWYFSTS